ncbi:ATP-grasp fold amidoligase family protein [Anaerosalibacter massiliensis]|uniref:ATP-grasp fold amidoligase family protein n=1 Tax=Anaerosalibacter massiliensis TaxID=1347392 RepID=UPI0005B2E106
MDYYYFGKEWAYKNIKRLVFVEEILYNEKGEIPSDFKLYMFNGELGAINIHLDRFEDNHDNISIDKDFKPFTGEEIPDYIDIETIKPKMFDEMTEYAKKLADDFDFIRVDFYDLGKDIVLGELTNYPAAGFKRLNKELDNYLGEIWTLPNV